MKNKIFLLAIFLSIAFNGFSQLKTYQFNQLDSLKAIAKKPVLVLMHTEWCQYCAAMMNAARTNSNLYEVLNKDFYLILLDAEDRNNIEFNGQIYRYKPNGLNNGFNELAVEFTKGRGGLVFPNLIFLDDKYKVVYHYASYLKPKDFISLLIDFKNKF
jgi:thioredoxin-related protein